MLRSLYRDGTVGFVDLYLMLEALVDFLGEADLLLWHEFVGKSLWL